MEAPKEEEGRRPLANKYAPIAFTEHKQGRLFFFDIFSNAA